MTAQEIKMLKDEEVIGFHRRLPPLQAKRMDWRDFPTLIERRAIPPPPIFPLPPLEDRPHSWQDQITDSFLDGYIDPDLLLVEGT